MNQSAFGVWVALLGRLRSVWRPMLTVNLAYALLGVVLLAPLPGLVVRLLMRLSGTTVIADQDIVSFLFTPLGLAALVLAGAILVAIAALAQASMMWIGLVALAPGVTALDALRFAAARLVPILDLSVRLVTRVLILMVPFLAVAAGAAWLLLTGHDINYYLSERPPSFWAAGALIAVTLSLMLARVVGKLTGWSLALALVLFSGVSPARSFGESERLTRGRRSLVLRVLVVWGLIALLLGVILAAILQGLGSWVVPPFVDALRLLVLVLGALVALWVVLSFAAAAFNGATFALAIVELARRLGAPIGTQAGAARPGPNGGGWRLGAGQVAAALAGAAAIAVLTGLWLIGGIEVPDEVIIVGHRGAAGQAPENTLAAVRRAIEDQADWVEIDVQESADGEVVVVHDSDFMKLAGKPLKVWEGTLEEIRRIDVGSWFGPEFAGERVPTLREVLETARGRVGLVIELKYYGHDQQLERRVVERVEDAGMAEDVAIMSLKHEGIAKIRALRPDWTVGLLAAKAIGDLTRLDADFLAVSTRMATAGFVRHARAAGTPVFVWTVNDPISISRALSLGVAGLITDEPAMARAVVEQRAAMDPVERLLVRTALLVGRPPPQRADRDESP